MECKFGICLPMYVYNDYRLQLVTNTFNSLNKTREQSYKVPLLIPKRHSHLFPQVFPPLNAFSLEIVEPPEIVNDTERPLLWGTTQLFEKHDWLTHVIWMGDDALFNPGWLEALDHLINRQPHARTWSVYRSTHVHFHAPLYETSEDVAVKSLCGHGLTWGRHDWNNLPFGEWAYSRHWVPGHWTVDLYHAANYPGERWCTKRSYIQHTGKEGVHCREWINEQAVDFVGE